MFISHWCPAKPAWQVHSNAFTWGEMKGSISKRRIHTVAMNYTCQTGICLTSTHSVLLTIHWFYLYDCYNNTISENEAANLFGGGGGGVVLSEPAVIGHSCCGVPANFLSVCLFVCLFFGEANKIKIK